MCPADYGLRVRTCAWARRSLALAGSRLENSAVAHEVPRRVCDLRHYPRGRADLGAREGNEAETGAEMEIATDPRSNDRSSVGCIGRNPVSSNL